MSVVPIRGRRWPDGRGTPEAFARRFGDGWCARVHAALNAADPLADAVVAIDGPRGAEVRRQLASGLVGGLASLERADEVVTALLRSTESVPAHVERNLIDSGPRAWYGVPFRLHLLSMSAGALIGVYASPSIASVLEATGRLGADTERRLRDTARWLSSTMLPGSLAAGAPGYVATVELRLVHAHARRTARRRGHDEGRFGTAINQVDLARTWLAFTLTALRAEASLGFAPSEAEIGECYGYWQQIAHLLGIDAALVGHVRSHDDAERLEAMVQATSGAPEGASARLTERMLTVVAEALDGATPGLPTGVSRKALEGLARRFHGDARADALGIGRAPGFGALMAPVATLARAHRAVRREDPSRWSAVAAGRYADALASALADQAAVPRVAPPIVDVARAPAPLDLPAIAVAAAEPEPRQAA